MTHPGAATEGDLLALQQWMLAWKSGDSHLCFEKWRAAYLERWKDAPAYADWLSQDSTGWCCWWQAEPILVVGVRVPYWTEGPGLTGDKIYAGHNLLGSVCCEPRPRPVEDPERAAYHARWKDAPANATHLAQDADGVCAFYECKPALDSDQNWFGPVVGDVERNLLGSVRCEPRPEVQS